MKGALAWEFRDEPPSPEIADLSLRLLHAMNDELDGATFEEVHSAVLHATMCILFALADDDTAAGVMLLRSAGAYFTRLAQINADA